MLAEQDEVMGKAISASWQLTEEEMIKAQCRAREDWIINNDYMNRLIAQLKDENAGLKDEIGILKQLLVEHGIPDPTADKQET